MIINNIHCLSILDGELSIQGAVFVAMTNYKEKLPPRIANRPGRFDRVEMVDCPPIAVQLEYLRRVEARGGKNPDAPERIVQALVGIPISMAHLREAFISHVLMGMSLTSVRSRFETMAGMKLSGELPDLVADDTTDDEDDWRKKERFENSAFWSPDSEE